MLLVAQSSSRGELAPPKSQKTTFFGNRFFLARAETPAGLNRCHQIVIMTSGLLCRPTIVEGLVHRVDISDRRRTAESVLEIEADEVPEVISRLARAKRLSIVMRNLNRLVLDHPADQRLGRCALRHLGFLDD